MSLDALAPDQRAVVQLVLQQDRSYEDLAALLGITPDAVRERAHRGLERLAPAEAVDPGDRAEITDYLLGQQSVSGRESTRGLLNRDAAARTWAQGVSAELADVARSPLPEVPAGAAAEPEPEPTLQATAPVAGFDTPVVTDPIVADVAPQAEEPAPTRARPRPRREPTPTPDFGFDEPEAEADRPAAAAGDDGANRTSRLGGALLIAGLGIFVAVLIVWLVSRGDDSSDKGSASTGTTSTQSDTPSASPTASGTPDFQAIGKLDLKSATGGGASGNLIVFAAQTGEVAFNIKAKKVPPTAEGQAYGVWLTGGGKDHFLGFAPPVGKDGKLAVSGPRDSDQANFAKWLSGSKQVVVSTETQEGATSPGPLVLTGRHRQGDELRRRRRHRNALARREQLPGVHDPGGVEALLDHPQQLRAARVLLRQPRRVVAPDRVVVGERAAGGEDRVARRRLGLRASAPPDRRPPRPAP